MTNPTIRSETTRIASRCSILLQVVTMFLAQSAEKGGGGDDGDMFGDTSYTKGDIFGEFSPLKVGIFD